MAPGIGTVIGAVVGLGVGLLYGAFRGSKQNTDYLDTRRGSQTAGKLMQRSSWFSIPRALLGKNPLDAIRGHPDSPCSGE